MAKREMPKKNDVVVEENVTTPVEETIEPKAEEPVDTTSIGIVTKCSKLNIRKKPNIDGKVVVVVDAKTKLTIINDKAIPNWYHVETAEGIKGYCMSKYVEVK